MEWYCAQNIWSEWGEYDTCVYMASQLLHMKGEYGVSITFQASHNVNPRQMKSTFKKR